MMGSTADTERARRLRKMKLTALAFLIGATIIYVICAIWGRSDAAPGFVGYVKAAAEAGMVGGVADWFAVTALFRYPLGIRIPHTAIIPTNKDALARNLGEFIGSNFLSRQVISERIASAGIAPRVGQWLAEPDHADRVSAEAGHLLRLGVGVLKDEDVTAVLEATVLRRVDEWQWSPVLGRMLEQVVHDHSHDWLVELCANRIHDWLLANYAVIDRLVDEHAPRWAPSFVHGRMASKAHTELVRLTAQMAVEPDHPLRHAIDDALLRLAADMQTDPETIVKLQQVKHDFLRRDDVREGIADMWRSVRQSLLDAADDPAGELRLRIKRGVISAGERMSTDVLWQERVTGWLTSGASYVVDNYRGELTRVISDTIDRWDTDETSRKIELAVGRDLQFIRINGTVVGAIAGLLIYSVTTLIQAL